MGIYVTRDGEGRVACRYTSARFPGQEHLADGSPDLAALRLGDAKSQRLRDLEQEFRRRSAAGFVYGGKAYQLDATSQANITAVAARAALVLSGAAGATWPEGFAFIATDNTAVGFTAEGFVPFADAAAGRVIALRIRFRALKDQIAAAETEAALAAIDLASGWE